MRVIKFRGKDKYTGKWVFGDLAHSKGISTNGLYDRVMVGGYHVIEETVGQFTGLLDKKGKEIYEGDLPQDKLGRISVCEFHHGGYWLRTIETSYSERLHSDSQIDIIGSIHDNPELLKGGDE